jgi:hypothetical protein
VARTDVFAMRDSGLNAFLFADVGLEANGSPLTVLSMLARLGNDPWAEAASWVGLSKATVREKLISSILRMPLSSEAWSDAAATATRLMQLLPSQSQAPEKSAAPATQLAAAVKWLRMTIFCGTIAFAIAVNYMMVMPTQHAAVMAPVGQASEPPPPG